MKNLFLSLILLLAVSVTASANNNDPKNTVKVIDDKYVSVSLSNADQTNIFTTVAFNENQNNLEFATKEAVSYVQIFDANGSLEFQLMIDSKKFKLSKKLFDNGSYKLGFMIDGQHDVHFADIEIK
jgi:hypothetical protein